jgi:glycosyltransferase involved in cell wall biosynthesis
MSQAISVVIPAWNSAAMLERCLSALGRSTLQPAEVIVVDDQSSDSGPEVAAAYGATLLFTGRRAGPGAARNLGVAHASTPLVVFFDADVEPHADTLERMAGHFGAESSLTAVFGSYDDAPSEPGLVSRFRNLLHAYFHHTGRRNTFTFWAGCGAIRRDHFLETGGFDESYSRPSIEDIAFGRKLARAGRMLHLDPSIQVKHLKRWTLFNMIRTDILDRALPWTRMLLDEHRMPNDLNLGWSQRLSVTLIGLVMVCLAAAMLFRRAVLLAPVPLLLLAHLWLNRRIFRFLSQRAGPGFSAACAPLLWLYHFSSGFGFFLGLLDHMFRRRTVP